MPARACRASVTGMRVDLLTREYPPNVYGGAGVHVAELSAVLRRSIDEVHRLVDRPNSLQWPRRSSEVVFHSEPPPRLTR